MNVILWVILGAVVGRGLASLINTSKWQTHQVMVIGILGAVSGGLSMVGLNLVSLWQIEFLSLTVALLTATNFVTILSAAITS